MNQIKNLKFKPSFILSNPTEFYKTNNINISGSLPKVMRLMQRDGAKCNCCQKDIFFAVVENEGKDWLHGMVQGSRITLDHNMLKSLKGSDDVANMHLLCEKCNLLRGNHFAEYQEFKDWYRTTKNPCKKTLPKMRNYCVLDFNTMTQHRSTDIAMMDVAGEKFKKEISTGYYTHGKVNSAYSNNMGLYKKLSVQGWNLLLNELLADAMKRRYSYTLPIEPKKFITDADYAKTPENFANRLSGKFEFHYREAVSIAKPFIEERKKAQAEVRNAILKQKIINELSTVQHLKIAFVKLFKKGDKNVSTVNV